MNWQDAILTVWFYICLLLQYKIKCIQYMFIIFSTYTDGVGQRIYTHNILKKSEKIVEWYLNTQYLFIKY